MADALEADVQKKLHLKPKKSAADDDEGKATSSSSSDEDVERVMAILSNEFGSDFKCTAGPSDCHYRDPLSQPPGIHHHSTHSSLHTQHIKSRKRKTKKKKNEFNWLIRMFLKSKICVIETRARSARQPFGKQSWAGCARPMVW